MERPDSPWYWTARLFRQSAPGDWVGAIGPVAEALSAWRTQRSPADVACGTGLSFPLLVSVGPGGRVAGVELSPDMLRLACARAARVGWTDVTLIESAVEEAELPGRFEALLFDFTHDVVQPAAALERLFANARAGARVAVWSSRLFPIWLAPANAIVRRLNAPDVTSFSGMEKPWRLLLGYVPELRIRAALWGAGYVASGRFVARDSYKVNAISRTTAPGSRMLATLRWR